MPTDSNEHHPQVRVQSVARAVAILLAVSRSANGLKAKQVSEQLNVSRQTVYHLVHTLVATGALRRNGEGRYVLGLAAASLADGFVRQLEPSEILAPRVRAIVAATGETAYASGWVDGEVVALVTARGNASVHAAEVPSGFRAHAHARASGKLLLAFADPGTRAAYFASHSLDAVTPWTITTREELDREFESIRHNGYAVDSQEFAEGLCCVAVPLQSLETRFTLCVSVPEARFGQNRDRYLAELRRIARTDSIDGLAGE